MLEARRARVLAVGLCVVFLAACSGAPCQSLGPEAYGMVARFGMSAPTPTRELAMGGAMTCLNDRQFANPAFAPLQQDPSVGMRVNTTDFDRGPRLTSTFLHCAYPTHPNESGFQLTVIDVDSSGGGASLPTMGPLDVSMSERAFVVDYGRRLSKRCTAGLSILGHEHVGLRLGLATTGQALLDLTDRAQYGGRVGATYEWFPGDYLGFMYSYAQDDVTASGAAMMGLTRHQVFHSGQLGLGASRHLTPELTAALEFQRGLSWSGPYSESSHTWHMGAEYQATPQWAVRAGASASNPTFGFGYAAGRWRADYAFIHNWNSNDVEELFGGSATHSLHVIFSW